MWRGNAVYLIVLGGDRWWRWRDFGLALSVPVLCGSMRWLVCTISCSISSSCHSNRRSGYSYCGCGGSIGSSYCVRCHRCLMDSVTGHCSGMGVGYSGSWLLTGRAGQERRVKGWKGSLGSQRVGEA